MFNSKEDLTTAEVNEAIIFFKVYRFNHLIHQLVGCFSINLQYMKLIYMKYRYKIFHGGSYMSALVLLNLINKFRKSDKMRDWQDI